MQRFPKVLLFLIVIIFASSMALAQYTVLYQKNGSSQGENFGTSVAGVGDIDRDSYPDFIVGAGGALGGNGSVFLYSGATGQLLYRLDGPGGQGSNDRFGSSVTGLADIDGDSVPDFIVGAILASPGGRVYAGSAFVYSGQSHALLFKIEGAFSGDELGCAAAGVGDINGDGKEDFIIGAPGASPGGLKYAGSTYVYSGATGALLYQKDGPVSDGEFGASVSGAGDLNGDGKNDFIVGAPATDSGAATRAGAAYLYSGTTGNLLYQKTGESALRYFGESVAIIDDVNGDGKADFIIGAPGSFGLISDTGSAYVYSGADGTLLFQKNGSATYDLFGISVTGAGDVNGDGKADFIIGALNASPDGYSFPGSAYVYSGADGALLFQKDGSANDELGYYVAGAGDVNRDAKADFIICAVNASPGGVANAGSVFIYSQACPAKGDLNEDTNLTPSDVVLMLNCVFLSRGTCGLCYSDIDCDGSITASDVVAELNAVFLGTPLNCP